MKQVLPLEVTGIRRQGTNQVAGAKQCQESLHPCQNRNIYIYFMTYARVQLLSNWKS